MSRQRQRPYGINWELLQLEAGQLLRGQPGWLAAGLAGPLLITLYTIFRPWYPARAERDLLQAALLFAAWNVLFAIGYALAAWLRPRQDVVEREQLHLPLSSAHFALRRLLQTSAVPLCAALLALPLWGALQLYYGVPYGVDADQACWAWSSSSELANPWWPRMAWLAAAILSAALLPAALAAWLSELTPLRYLRCILMLGIPAGLYFVVRVAVGDSVFVGASGYWGSGYGPLFMNYRQTRGVDPLPYLILLGLCIVGPLLIGWLRPAWRWLLLGLPVLLLGAFMLRKALPEQLRAPLRPLSTALFGRDTRYAAGLFIGHLSPPKNIRLLKDSYPSNVLFQGQVTVAPAIEPQQPMLPPEPPYPGWPDPNDPLAPTQEDYDNYELSYEKWAAETAPVREPYIQEIDAYRKAVEAYEAQKTDWPRLALWVGAGLYPLLLPLWGIAGLLLGISLRNEPQRSS